MYSSCLPPAAAIIDITVQIRSNGAVPTLGQSYSLTCELTDASGLIPFEFSMYQWRKDGTIVSTTSSLSFSSLSLSDAGRYICQAIVDGITFSRAKDIRLSS